MKIFLVLFHFTRVFIDIKHNKVYLNKQQYIRTTHAFTIYLDKPDDKDQNQSSSNNE